jgi:cyanophycinase
MAGDLFLVGGGRDEAAATGMYAPFLGACTSDKPTVACVIMDDGDGQEVFDRFASLLTAAGDCEPVPVLVPQDRVFDVAALHGTDAMLVCGGLTPSYAAALAPAAGAIREWLAAGRPYAGFSAGSAIAADRAVVGGWLIDGVAVCHEDCAEDLDELTVVDGLGLVPFAIDVHCAQWGTLSRLVAAVSAGSVLAGIGLDENTVLSIRDGAAAVVGLGAAWVVIPSGPGGATVRMVRPGEPLELPAHLTTMAPPR